MKNFLKIFALLFLTLINNSGFTSEHCSLKQYNAENTTTDVVKGFFEDYNEQVIEGHAIFGRNYKEDFISLELVNKYVLYVNNTGTLTVSAGNTASIIDNSKLYISGKLIVEPNSIINIGDKESNKGGYLILNSLHKINLEGLTINLNDENSHLEIHGNDISLTDCKINCYNPKATFHIQNKLLPNTLFNPLCTSEVEPNIEIEENAGIDVGGEGK